MRVIQVHNRYRTYGGEDAVFDQTIRLLRERGIEVTTLERRSAELGDGIAERLRAGLGGVYRPEGARAMRGLLERVRPDVVHAHNLYPLLTPAVLRACRTAGVPAVMTCHNYRLVCPIGTHLRDGAVCEACSGGREYRCLLHNCRGRFTESAAYALRGTLARGLGLFRDAVATFIALTEFQKGRLVRAGFEADRIAVLPNFVELPEAPARPADGTYALFVGRLSAEKGVRTLLRSARALPSLELRLAGPWQLRERPEALAPPNASLLGSLDSSRLAELYRGARCVVLPSEWFEGCPMVALEALAHGVPIVASRIGGLPELVEDGVTGLLFEPGSVDDLSEKLQRLRGDAALCERLGRAARDRAQKLFAPDAHFERLLAIYQTARERVL